MLLLLPEFEVELCVLALGKRHQLFTSVHKHQGEQQPQICLEVTHGRSKGTKKEFTLIEAEVHHVEEEEVEDKGE